MENEQSAIGGNPQYRTRSGSDRVLAFKTAFGVRFLLTWRYDPLRTSRAIVDHSYFFDRYQAIFDQCIENRQKLLNPLQAIDDFDDHGQIL